MSELPKRPNLEQLKRQARELLQTHRSGDPGTRARIRAAHPGYASASDAALAAGPFTLRDAQLVLAREHGFPNWARLKHHIETGKENLQALIDAVRLNQPARIRALLREDPALAEHLDAPHWSFAAPAVVAAAEHGHHDGSDPAVVESVRERIDVLIEAGADVDARSEWWAGSWGVLHRAPRALAQYLISRGAQVDVHSAARLDLGERLSEILRADPALARAPGPDGMTPLHFAATPAIAAQLLAHGAELDARDVDHGGTPAQHALVDRPEVCRALLAQGATPDMCMACHLGDVELARTVLARDPGALDFGGGMRAFLGAPGGHIYVYTLAVFFRPLLIAARRDAPELHAFLLERSTPREQLMFAVARHDRERAHALARDHPGIVRALPRADMCRLCEAAWERDIEAVRLMLELGYDVDVRGVHGATALDRAALRGDREIVALLLAHRPSLTVQNEFGGTPLGACIWGSVNPPGPAPDADHVGTLELLIAAGSPLPDALGGSAAVQAALRRHGVGDPPAR